MPPIPELAGFCNKLWWLIRSNAYTYRDRSCLLDLLDLGSFQYSSVHPANSWHKIYPGDNHVDCYVLFGTSDHGCCWKCSVLRRLKQSAREKWVGNLQCVLDYLSCAQELRLLVSNLGIFFLAEVICWIICREKVWLLMLFL